MNASDSSKLLLMHGTVGTLLAYLNSIVFVVVFTHTDKLRPGSDWLVSCRQWLAVVGYYYHHCLSDNQQRLCTKVEETGSLQSGLLTSRDG